MTNVAALDTEVPTTRMFSIVQVLCVAQALEFHVKTGGRMRLTRVATPARMMDMMDMARSITGVAFKPRAYTEAAAACREVLGRLRDLRAA